MKNNYLLLFAFFFFAIGFSQTPIVTIDRDNVAGPTATGNDPSISSVGITRGAGINLRAGTDFTSNNWTGASLADAITNNDYMQWSTTASATNDIEIQTVDIRLRRNTNGPENWQLYYSLDNFATAGIAVNTPQTLAAFTNVTTNITGLSINSGTAGTITFRLYAWGGLTNGGWLRVRQEPSWSDFGIVLPGIRLSGTINATTPNSTESNIISTAFDPNDNIDYSAYNATSGLTTLNAIKIGEFSIQDGGDDLIDADALNTTLSEIDFGVTNSSNIAALAIFDGAINISEVTTVSGVTSFTGITGLSATDDSSKVFDVYATFDSTVTDNEQIQLTIISATADGSTGSVFLAFDAGGAQTPIVADDNRIEVTANALIFNQEPVDTFQFETMTPSPIVFAVDGNDNQDLDYNGTVSVVSSGSLEPGIIDYTMTNGTAILNTIVYTEKETVTTLLAFGGALSPAISNPFDVDGPLITIAQQDFDGTTPEWTYTTDVALFDNGWAFDGYYGVIDITSAAPLDNPSFSNNIFGEHDLNDEGENGTTGFATLTLDPIDISNFENVTLSFDWDIHGYVNNTDDAQYRLIYDGVPQALVFLLDGDGPVDTDQGTVTLEIPDAVSTLALEIKVRNNGSNGFSGFDNFKLISVFDGLLYVDNGWSPNPPSGSTGTENAYVLDGTYNVGTNIEINNLYINDSATTTVSAGQSITSNSGLVNFGTLEMNSVSTSYSSLITTGNAQGEIIYNRHVNQLAPTGSTTGFNDLVAAPVTNSDQTFLALRTANPDIPSGTIGGVPSFLFGPFDNVANEYINYTAADDASLVEAGVGYRTASTAATGSTFRFVGNVETTTNLVPITVGAGSTFNLIGNPYPSYITLADFLAANNSEFDAITSGVYAYDGDLSDDFTIWNQAYSDANPTALIAPGQGFFVSSKVGGGTITFSPSMRSIGTSDDFIPGRMSNPIAHLKLEMRSENELFKTDFYFNDNASLGMDAGYDTAMFNSVTPDFALYSHLAQNNNGLDLAVQSLNYDAINDVIIPLGINASQGQQLTISIFETDVADGIDVYLEDTLTNTFTLLNTSDYVFTPNTDLSGTGRFFLRFTSDVLSTPEENFDTVQIYTTKTPKALFIKGELNTDTKAEIYDIQGRMILNTPLDSSSTNNQIDISNFNSGVYIVKLSNSSQQKTQKVIIK
ncbi:T9SS type A sorting domain-containing protein [uncultured Psychroserpens sp.]|uniref:T9SS type A sorting domain-containing protein n=1 Tax=uncultured Psychroserpens sp. TaxID=255436 RepID=UPI00260FE979|nr:T9SS type A sorting domain-containing protein [uncultured Psychroserpens sp.]